MPVKDKKHFHGRVSDAFVAVDERMILYERESESRSLFGNRRI